LPKHHKNQNGSNNNAHNPKHFFNYFHNFGFFIIRNSEKVVGYDHTTYSQISFNPSIWYLCEWGDKSAQSQNKVLPHQLDTKALLECRQ
jgi:hypothetical protein